MDDRKPFDVKAYILKAAEESGLQGEAAEEFATKCYDYMPMIWEPYGGAKSFSEIDTQRNADQYKFKVQDETDALRGIINNITGSEDMSAADKKAAITSAADDFETRVSALDVNRPEGTKSLTGAFIARFKQVILKGDKAAGSAEAILDTGFKMYVDTQGNLRWLSMSSNAFEDKHKELFTTKALEEAVDWADKSGERGPLLFYHVPTAPIGDCDFQAVSGRFLVESGTFRDTELGRKAVEYFIGHPDLKWQTSIGFKYKAGDELDGQFDWTRIEERSVLPDGAAANSWTDFKVIGDTAMNTKAQEALTAVFGATITTKVIEEAASRTKELEQSGVRFKSADGEEATAVKMTAEEFGDITEETKVEVKAEDAAAAAAKAEEPVFQVLSHEHGDIRHTHRVKSESEHEHETAPTGYKADKFVPFKKGDDKEKEDDDKEKAKKEEGDTPAADASAAKSEFDPTKLAEVLVDLTNKVDSVLELGSKMTEIETGMKSLQRTEQQRVDDYWTPRGFPGGVRPSEASGNLVDGAKADELLGKTEDPPVNPATPYVQDIMRPGARIAQG